MCWQATSQSEVYDGRLGWSPILVKCWPLTANGQQVQLLLPVKRSGVNTVRHQKKQTHAEEIMNNG
jgi:hypothetical protein